MSPRLPAVRAEHLLRVLPLHRGRDLGRGLLRKIMRDADLTVKDLLE